MKLATLVGLGPGHTVLDGEPAPPPQRGEVPPFSGHTCCGQMAGWIKMPLGMEIGLGPSDIGLDGNPAPHPTKRGQSPQFLAHDYCGQTAGWIKIALGMEVGLGPGHIVLDGDPAPLPKKGAQPRIFGPLLLWLTCWMHQDTSWYGGRPRPRPHCARWGPAPLPKRAQPHPAARV